MPFTQFYLPHLQSGHLLRQSGLLLFRLRQTGMRIEQLAIQRLGLVFGHLQGRLQANL